MEAYVEDCKDLVSQLKKQDKELRLKRRWLMNLHLSEREQKKMERLKPPGDMSLPESLLRENDLHYENIRTSVAKAFGVHKGERACYGAPATLLSNSAENLRGIYSMLNKMNNKGLCCVAETLTGGSITFEKTNWLMSWIIKHFPPKILHKHDDSSQSLIKQMSQHLKDPQNLRVNHGASCSTSESFLNSAIYVLDRLKELSLLTLSKMHRNLRDLPGYIPIFMQSPRISWNIERLVDQIRRTSLEMLADYEEGDEPPEPLAKALSVAALMLKPELDYCPFQMVFHKLSPNVEALQNDIAKAIRILDDKKLVCFAELGNLPLVLDSKAKAAKKSVRLRVQLKKLLTEYLLECSDLQSIPESLLESLAIINKTYRHARSKTYSKKEVEEEIECVLTISAQIKQIVLDLLVKCDVSEDFANAYMVKAEESYDEGGDEDEHLSDLHQNCRSDPNVSYSQAESVGEINESDFKSPITACQDIGLSSLFSPKLKSSVKLESVYTDKVDSVHSNWFDNSSAFLESKASEGAKSMSGKDDHLRSIGRQEGRDSCSPMPTRDQNSFATHFSPDKGSGRNHMEGKTTAGDLGCTPPKFTSIECSEEKNVSLHRQKLIRNQYLLIQEGSDETSMVAYTLVGCMLNKFAQLDGLHLSEDDVSYLQVQGNTSNPKNFEVPNNRQSSCDETTNSVMLHVLEEIIPSFANSSKEQLKELLGVK
ncbi:putative COP9 signalosome complex subunit 5b-like [Capsicum annuum]|nr:putative COP9 signalosome complex subunit 5b-like [Capsicum annuum]